MDQDVNLDALATTIVARVQPRDDSWFFLASKALLISEAALRDYATHGESLSLAILIHVVRQQFSLFWKMYRSNVGFRQVLEAASKISVQDTLPELWPDFCEIWNQIVREVQRKDDHMMAFYILGRIRNVFLALHQQTESAPPIQFSPFTGDQDDILYDPFSYPLCIYLETIQTRHPWATSITTMCSYGMAPATLYPFLPSPPVVQTRPVCPHMPQFASMKPLPLHRSSTKICTT